MLAYIFIALTALVSLSTAGYVLQDDYNSNSFFSMFDFFTSGDPTHGYVQYVDQGTAQSSGLINNNNGMVYMGVDHTNIASGAGRASVRITSKKSYNHGLVILDLAHMPGGICGTWPAFWMVGPGWPNSGEIDIIEGVNSQNANAMTLHTAAGCSITNNGLFTGQIATSNCNVNAPGQFANAGCQITTPNTASYGAGFNAGQGGVYATEWTSDGISIWFFPRGAVPNDIVSGWPDPSGWGTPIAHFSGGCQIDNFFKNQQIVFDTTFCGDWAGNTWAADSTCSTKAPTCQSFVQNNPTAFTDAYWSVNSLKVYSANGAATHPSATGWKGDNAWSASVAYASASASGAVPMPMPLSPTDTKSDAATDAAGGQQAQSSFGFSRDGNSRHRSTIAALDDGGVVGAVATEAPATYDKAADTIASFAATTTLHLTSTPTLITTAAASDFSLPISAAVTTAEADPTHTHTSPPSPSEVGSSMPPAVNAAAAVLVPTDSGPIQEVNEGAFYAVEGMIAMETDTVTLTVTRGPPATATPALATPESATPESATVSALTEEDFAPANHLHLHRDRDVDASSLETEEPNQGEDSEIRRMVMMMERRQHLQQHRRAHLHRHRHAQEPRAHLHGRRGGGSGSGGS